MKKGFNQIKQTFVGFGSSILRQVLVILLALGISAVVLLISGHNPLDVYSGLVKGAFTDIYGTIRWATPLIIAGLAISVAFRSGVFNLGVDGQLYMGAIAAAWIGLNFPNIPAPFSILAAILAGMLAGALYAFIPGILRTLWGVSEVVTTLLMNFIAVLFTDYLIFGPMKATGVAASGSTGTNRLPVQFYLPRLSPDSQANLGIFIAIALGIILAFLLFRTTLGFEFRLVGKNSLFSRYGGINTKKVALSSMCLSGAIGGLIGVIEILGVHRRLPSQFGNGLGFDGIVVSLLAGNHPIGVIFSGFFFGALRNGAMNMERLTNVPRAMVDIVNAIVVLMASAQFAISFFRNRNKRKGPLEPEATKVNQVMKNPGED